MFARIKSKDSLGPLGLALVVLAVAAIHVVVLAPVFGAGRFADDWQFEFERPWEVASRSFLTRHPYTLYRPIQLLVASSSMAASSGSLAGAQWATLALHVALVAWVLYALGRSGVSRRGQFAAALFLASTQLAANAAGANDTLSLVLSTLAGSWAVWSLWGRVRTGGALLPVLGGLLFACLAKESGLGYVLAAVAVVIATPGDATRSSRLLLAAAALSLAAIYLLWRGIVVGAAPPDSRLFGIGLEVPANLVQLWLAALMPLRITEFFTAMATRDLSRLALGLVLTAGFVTSLAFGSFASGRLRALGTLVALASLAVSPVLVMRHVSQLYAYAFLPVVAAGVAWMTDGFGLKRAAPLLLLVCAFLVSGQRGDAEAMAANGRRGEVLMRGIRAIVRDAAPEDVVIFADRVGPVPDYSVFRMSPFRLAQPLEAVRLEHRDDLAWRVIPEDSLHAIKGSAMVVTVDSADVVRMVRREEH